MSRNVRVRHLLPRYVRTRTDDAKPPDGYLPPRSHTARRWKKTARLCAWSHTPTQPRWLLVTAGRCSACMPVGAYQTEFGVLHRGTNGEIEQDTTDVSGVRIGFVPSEGALDIYFKVGDDGENPWRHLCVPVTASPRWTAFVQSLPQSWEAGDATTETATDGDDE